MKQFILLSVLIPLLSFTAKEWVKISPDSHTTLSFPSSPKTSTEGVATVLKAADGKTEKASSINCIFSMIDLSKMGMTKEKMAADLTKPSTIDEFGKGILAKFKGGTMLAKSQTLHKGYSAFNYTISTGVQPGLHLTLMHTRVVFVGTTMYTLSVYESPAKPQEALRNRFFDSFEISK